MKGFKTIKNELMKIAGHGIRTHKKFAFIQILKVTRLSLHGRTGCYIKKCLGRSFTIAILV